MAAKSMGSHEFHGAAGSSFRVTTRPEPFRRSRYFKMWLSSRKQIGAGKTRDLASQGYELVLPTARSLLFPITCCLTAGMPPPSGNGKCSCFWHLLAIASNPNLLSVSTKRCVRLGLGPNASCAASALKALQCRANGAPSRGRLRRLPHPWRGDSADGARETAKKAVVRPI